MSKPLAEIMSSRRFLRWMEVSFAVVRFTPSMMSFTRGLGYFDVELVRTERFLVRGHKDRFNRLEYAFQLSGHVTQSYLWVLGAYELIRSVSQRCNEAPDILSDTVIQSLRKTKDEFARLRIPLAKFEAARDHMDTDFSTALPVLHPRFGISWRVSEDAFISRIGLSNNLLKALGGILQ